MTQGNIGEYPDVMHILEQEVAKIDGTYIPPEMPPVTKADLAKPSPKGGELPDLDHILREAIARRDGKPVKPKLPESLGDVLRAATSRKNGPAPGEAG